MEMKAVVYDKYGSAEVLKLEEMSTPQPSENEVLVRVHAASINAGDLHMRNGNPFIARLYAGLFSSKTKNFGYNFLWRNHSDRFRC